MSKELKEVKSIYNLLKLIPQGYHRKQKNGCIVLLEDLLNERIGRIKNNLLTIQQALTPPTEEEVCKALSEYCKTNIKFDGVEGFYYTALNMDLYLVQYTHGVVILPDNEMYYLPPHLIIMIGQFYKDKERKEG